MMLTTTPDTWDFRRAFRTSLSIHDKGRGRWRASTPALDLRFAIEHQRISQVAVLQISCEGRERYDFVPQCSGLHRRAAGRWNPPRLRPGADLTGQFYVEINGVENGGVLMTIAN